MLYECIVVPIDNYSIGMIKVRTTKLFLSKEKIIPNNV